MRGYAVASGANMPPASKVPARRPVPTQAPRRRAGVQLLQIRQYAAIYTAYCRHVQGGAPCPLSKS